MQGGPFGHGHDRNKLLLRRVQGSSDLARLAVIMANYTSKSSFTNCLLHLKGKEDFGSSKQYNDYLPCVDNDSHCFNHMNFFHLQITIPTIESNIVDDVHMQQPAFSSNKLLPLVFQGALELKENICVDDQWCIECCPPNYVIQCFDMQKTTVFKCKTKINLCKFVSGIFVPCYSGFVQMT